MKTLRAFISLALLAMSGCATSGTATNPDVGPFGGLSDLTVTDLQAALARATAAGDQAAMQCYPVLISLVQGMPGQVPQPKVAGIVDAFEEARLLSKKAQGASGATNPAVQAINLGCAALFNDSQGDLLRLGIKFRL